MKKKKKNSLNKKEKRIFICLGVALLIILILIIITIPLKNKKPAVEQQNNIDLNEELTSIKQVVEYLEASYLYEENSTENGYDTDVYLSFKYNLYEGDESKSLYFTNFYEKIAMVSNFKSFRLIDNSKAITIKVKCSNNKITEVKINDEEDYFKKEDSRRSQKNEINVETLNLEVNSQVLNDLINSNWTESNVNFGTQESTFDKYKIYFDEGYEVRSIQGKVYNIVFTQNYAGTVVNGYKVGERLDIIESQLGTSYKSDSSIIGYKTENFYIFFSNKEISIYPNVRYDYTEFEKLIEKYKNDKDMNDLMYNLTDIWPDYDRYTTGENYFDIYYTLKGVRISYSSINPVGIQIYENYKGELKTKQEEIKNLYYKLDQNLIINRENERLMQDQFYDDSGKQENPLLYSDKFYLSATKDETNYTKVKIISLDGTYPNNELDDTILIYKYVWADDTHLIYTIQGNGMYIYNAETRQTETLMQGTEQFEIKDYDRNTHIIKYDNSESRIEF